MTEPGWIANLNHDIEEIWEFLEHRGVLRIVHRDGRVRLLLNSGDLLEATPKALESLLARDRARLRLEERGASGRRAFVGLRIEANYSRLWGVEVSSDAKPQHVMVGSDKEKLLRIRKEWQDLKTWTIDIKRLFNLIAVGEIDIPPRFLSTRSEGGRHESHRNDEPADLLKTREAISWCVRKYKEARSIGERVSQAGIAGEAVRRFLPDIAEYTGQIGKTGKKLKNRVWLLKRDSILKSYLPKLSSGRKKRKHLE